MTDSTEVEYVRAYDSTTSPVATSTTPSRRDAVPVERRITAKVPGPVT
ncbi:hypothetical protein [Streptomyces sp. NPDC001744]